MSPRLQLPPLSLYIHVPWCVRKCPYCDFNSHEAGEKLPEKAYVRALLDDLESDAGLIQDRELHSIFIGGGTPSLFSAEAFNELFDGLKRQLPFHDEIEITMEANPGTFEQEKFAEFRAAGINRLSIGIQSFEDEKLHALGRIHDSAEAFRATEIARDAGFGNINLDLMFGLPGQSENDALSDLTTAIACAPEHLSWYQLTIEPNTVFYRRPPKLPAFDLIDRIQEAGIALLGDNGYRRYEISAYGREGKAARHNLNYWTFGDYLGIGAGAHGKLTLPAEGRIIRTRKIRQPAAYLASARRIAETREIPSSELPLEFMMNALRLVKGVETSLFPERTGLDPAGLDDILMQLRERGLLVEDRLQTTPRGLNLLNEVLQFFMV